MEALDAWSRLLGRIGKRLHVNHDIPYAQYLGWQGGDSSEVLRESQDRVYMQLALRPTCAYA